jgi:hypothetical protein
MALYTLFFAVFSIWRGFCMSGRKLLDPTMYVPDIYRDHNTNGARGGADG